MANPFDTSHQVPNLMPGLKMLGGAMQRREGFERERVKKKQGEDLRAKAVKVFQTGDPQMMAAFVGKNPGAKDVFKEMTGASTDAMVTDAKRWLLSDEDPVEIESEKALAAAEAGEDFSENVKNIEGLVKNQDAERKKREMVLAIHDPKAFAAYQKQQDVNTGMPGKDTRTAEIKNWEYGKKNPEFAKMRKKADESKLTENELRLATMLANGEIDASQLPKRGNTYNKIVAGAKELNPELDIRSATADYALSKNPAFRQKTMTAEVLPDIMKHVVEAGKKVNFSNLKKVGGIQKLYKENINDPDFVEYMALRNDALMEIASVMRGGGMTDKAHEAEVEAMHPTMSPRALDAWIKAQNKALKPRLAIMRKIIDGPGKPKPETQSKYTEGQTANGGKLIFSNGVWRDNI